MTKLLDLPDEARLGRRVFGFFEDFFEFVTADLWTVATTTDGTATLGDAAGGIMSILTAVATEDNEHTVLATTKELFLFAADKPILFEARVDFDEANTDDANMYVGLMSAAGTTPMQDDGAGPKGTMSGMGFFKVDGGTVWQCISSLGTSQTITELSATNANNISGVAQTAGGAYQTLCCEFRPWSSTKAEVLFFIDGTLVAKHDLVFTSATEMNVALVAKDGSAANEETLRVDYVSCYQLR